MAARFQPNENQWFNQYLNTIAPIKQLSWEEEQDLIRKIRTGCSVALEKLLRANLRLAALEARKYQYQGVSLRDLVCEANLGLAEAAQKCQPGYKARFFSYALVGYIRPRILKALGRN